MDLSRVIWRKSRRSGNGDQNCVEVGVWGRNSRSSDNGGQRVEVASAGRAVVVRDSKNSDGPKLAFALPIWVTFADRAKQGGFDLTRVTSPQCGDPSLQSMKQIDPGYDSILI